MIDKATTKYIRIQRNIRDRRDKGKSRNKEDDMLDYLADEHTSPTPECVTHYWPLYQHLKLRLGLNDAGVGVGLEVTRIDSAGSSLGAADAQVLQGSTANLITTHLHQLSFESKGRAIPKNCIKQDFKLKLQNFWGA